MLNKSSRLLMVITLLTTLSMFFFGCGKFGNRFANKPPTITITSYEGSENTSNPDSIAVTLFQQRIYWHAIDQDGIVKGFAYRILDANGNPIPTPGNQYIDTDNTVTPQKVFEKFGGGWVLHYQAGADQSLPLSNPQAKRTIWTTQKYAFVNFPANSGGQPDTTISRFEVICVDNRGDICEQKAFRIFRSYSIRPTCFLTTTKGNPNGGQVGTGIRLSFTIDDGDPYLQPTADYYLFKLEKRDVSNHALISETEWFSTKNQPKINQFLLRRNTTPSISNDYGTPGTYTKVIAKAVDLAGIVSDTTSIKFRVKEGFHPSTIVYKQRMYCLGDYHYIDYTDESTSDVLPYTIKDGENRYGTPFFRARDSVYTVVHSNNLKIWLRWGWHGEYGNPQSSGVTIITDNPFDKKVDMLLDETTDKNYYSEITHFDIRLDNQPYYYPPLANSIHVDEPTPEFPTGKRWLRVPINSTLGQTIVVTNIQPGNHVFEVRAVDLQDVADPTPAVFSYRVESPILPAQKSGILIIDDEIHNNFAPNDTIDARYANMLSNYGGTITTIKRASLAGSRDIKDRYIAFSDIQQYKLIIYHDDNPTATSNFQADYDAYNMYLNSGGNMIISGGGTLSQMVQGCINSKLRLFNKFFGIPYLSGTTSSVTGNMLSKNYFIKAKANIAGYSDLQLAFDMDVNNPNPAHFISNGVVILEDPNERAFLGLMNTYKGLGPITYINSLSQGATILFKYGSKPVFPPGNTSNPTAPYYFPPVSDFELYNNKTVGVKYTTPKNTCYFLGFPLSYMVKAHAKQFLNKVISEVNP